MHSSDPWRAMLSAPPYLQPRLPVARPSRVAGSFAGEFKQIPRLRGDYRPRSGLLRELAPILAPATGGVAYELDFDDASGMLKATIAVDDRIYTTSLDLSPLVACAMEKAAAYQAELHAEEHARGTPLVGAVPFVAVGADCGTRVYAGVTQRVLAEIIRAVQAQGMTVVANGNTFDVDTHQASVTLRAVWNQASSVLSLSVDGPGMLCDQAWNTIDPTLRAAINQAAGSATLLTHVENAVEVAGEALVDGLVEHHKRTICGGWFGDLERDVKHAVNTVEHDVKSAVHTVEHTVKELGPLLEKAAPIAAGAIAGVLLGPEAAPLAAGLAGSLVNAATGKGSLKQVAQQVVNDAQAAAASDPDAAAVLQAAQQAVATTTAATHIAKTAAQAASGNAGARQQMQQLASSAAQGDPAAQQAMGLAQNAASTLSSSPDQIAAAASNLAGVDPSSLTPPDLGDAVSQAISGWFSSLERDVKRDIHKAEHAIEKNVPFGKDLVQAAEDIEKYTTPEGLTAMAAEAAFGGHGHGHEHGHGKPRVRGWFGDLERDVKKDVRKAEHAIERNVPFGKDLVQAAEDIEKYTTPEGLTAMAAEAAFGGHGRGREHGHGKPHVRGEVDLGLENTRPYGWSRAAKYAVARAPRSAAYGYRHRRGVDSVLLFPSSQDAMQWLSALDPSSVDYAAVFDARSGVATLTSQLLGSSSEDLGREYADALTGPEPDQVAVRGNVALIGAAADALTGLRQRASDVAVQVHSNTGHDVVAVVIRPDGTVATATYASSDAADDAFGNVTRLPFAYAAYYDAGDMTWPGPLNEAVGGGPVASAPGGTIHRGAATTGA